MFRMNSGCAHDEFVEVELLDGIKRCRSYHGERSGQRIEPPVGLTVVLGWLWQWSNFGQINNTRSLPRIIQLSAHYAF